MHSFTRKISIGIFFLAMVLFFNACTKENISPQDGKNSPEDKLYVASVRDGYILRMPKNGGPLDTLYKREKDNIFYPGDLFVDPASGKLLIADLSGIYRSGNRNGGELLQDPFSQFQWEINPMAVSRLADGRFVALDNFMGIFFSHPNASFVDVKYSNFANTMTDGIAIDEDNGRIYWGRMNAIMRANLNGTGSPVEIANISSVKYLVALVYSKNTDKLYFTDNDQEGLFEMTTDGKVVRRLATILNASGMTLDVDDQMLYIGCSDNNRKIYKYSLKDNRLDSLNVSFSEVSGLYVY